jgi:uracil phosphoribosyltransferase
MLTYEATLGFRLKDEEIELEPTKEDRERVSDTENELTPKRAKMKILEKKKPIIVPILRSGLPMAEGVREILQTSYMGHIGLHRQGRSEELIEYLVTLPTSRTARDFIITDPVMATGITACRAIEILREFRVPYENMHFLSIIITERAKERIEAAYANDSREPSGDLNIYYVAVDTLTNGRDIEPGVGVVSNRLFRTI